MMDAGLWINAPKTNKQTDLKIEWREMTEKMKQLNYITSFILQDVKYQYLLWKQAVHTT